MAWLAYVQFLLLLTLFVYAFVIILFFVLLKVTLGVMLYECTDYLLSICLVSSRSLGSGSSAKSNSKP